MSCEIFNKDKNERTIKINKVDYKFVFNMQAVMDLEDAYENLDNIFEKMKDITTNKKRLRNTLDILYIVLKSNNDLSIDEKQFNNQFNIKDVNFLSTQLVKAFYEDVLNINDDDEEEKTENKTSSKTDNKKK